MRSLAFWPSMNTRDVNSVLGGDSLSSMILGGAMAADQFGKVFLTLPPSFFVVNSHDSSLPGEHWLAVYHSSPYYAEIFYSYGLPIEMYPIIQFTVGLFPVTNSLTTL